MRPRISKELTRVETYSVTISRDCETGVVVSESWYREGAPKFERRVKRDRITGEVTSERFRAGALKTTQQYGPQLKDRNAIARNTKRSNFQPKAT